MLSYSQINVLILCLLPLIELHLCDVQAEKRQARFESSATGRAAMASVRAVKMERQQGERSEGPDLTKDWLS